MKMKVRELKALIREAALNEYEDYYTSAEEEQIDLRRALVELEKHSAFDVQNVAEFISEMGPGPYSAQDVLGWLGY